MSLSTAALSVSSSASTALRVLASISMSDASVVLSAATVSLSALSEAPSAPSSVTLAWIGGMAIHIEEERACTGTTPRQPRRVSKRARSLHRRLQLLHGQGR